MAKNKFSKTKLPKNIQTTKKRAAKGEVALIPLKRIAYQF